MNILLFDGESQIHSDDEFIGNKTYEDIMRGISPDSDVEKELEENAEMLIDIETNVAKLRFSRAKEKMAQYIKEHGKIEMPDYDV